MTLGNLITFSDDRMTMAIYRKKSFSEGGFRYNFVKRKWDENTILAPEKLITVKQFRLSKLYNTFAKNKVITMSAINASSCKEIPSDYFCKRGKIMSITID